MLSDWDSLKCCRFGKELTLSETSPGFYVSAVIRKTLWEKDKLLVTSNFSFSHSVFYALGELSYNLKLSSANPFSLGQSKILSFCKVLIFEFCFM